MPTILHLEMPRALTTTLRPPLAMVRGQLAQRNIAFLQRDANLSFWRWLHPELLEDLADLMDGSSNLQKWLACVEQATLEASALPVPASIEVSHGGLNPPKEIVASSKRLVDWVQQPDIAKFYDSFVDELECIHGSFSDFDLLSLGVTSAEALPVAIRVAARAKGRGSSSALSLHNYENFSLLYVWEEVLGRTTLPRQFDAIVKYEEYLAESLAALVTPGANLVNCACFRDGSVVEYVDPTEQIEAEPSFDADYIATIPFSHKNVILQTNLVGNKCFYGKCTFCVQISKHHSDNFREAKSTIPSTLDLLTFFNRECGIRHFSFIDEALKPADLRVFADRVLEQGLDIAWCGRAIPHKAFDRALIDTIAAAGCQEILLGVETVDRATSAKMGKLSAHAGEESVTQTVLDFQTSDVDVVLSMIHRFPAADEASDNLNRAFCLKLRDQSENTSIILNNFSLFCSTPIYETPESFGIVKRGKRLPENDLQIEFNYQDKFGRTGFENTWCIDDLLILLGLRSEDAALLERPGVLERLFHVNYLDYASFGIVYRNRTGRYLKAELTREIVSSYKEKSI